MGIRGLTSLLLEDPALVELCASNPRQGGDGDTDQRRKGEKKKEDDARERAVVLVDALSCFFSFFQKADSKIRFETPERRKNEREKEREHKHEEEEEDEEDQPSAIAFRLLLGDYSEFCAWASNIHLAFSENGFEMRYYFDNVDPASDPFYKDKLETRLRRKEQRIKSLRHIEKILSKGSIHAAKWHRIKADFKLFIPVLALDQLLGTLNKLGATVIQ